jgi:hypothetical protein
MNRATRELREEHKVKFYAGNGSPLLARKIGRNDKCRCGSDKKAKSCCGAETQLYHSKKKEIDRIEEIIQNENITEAQP